MQFVLQFAELRGEFRTVGPKGLLPAPLFQEQTYVFTLVVQLVLLGGVLPWIENGADPGRHHMTVIPDGSVRSSSEMS